MPAAVSTTIVGFLLEPGQMPQQVMLLALAEIGGLSSPEAPQMTCTPWGLG
jgi:hypothetical protein